tara:strand:+ start:209 stop:763 length:555 start_codon:yes stop_codon:yes gene_type:complete
MLKVSDGYRLGVVVSQVRKLLVGCFLAVVGFFGSPAHAHLQCVPYARDVSGISIHGNAHTWWDQADGKFARGQEPQVGAILAFQSSRAMPLGHVAVVAQIIDDRQIILNHANWSGPGMIERHALAVDVSEAGDWSSVRVWFGPSHALGSRHNPTFGFIYDDPAGHGGSQTIVAGVDAASKSFSG